MITKQKSNICLIGGGGFIGTSFRNAYHDQYNKCVILGRSVETAGLRSNEIYHSIATLSVEKVAAILADEEVDTIVDLSYNTIPKSSFENPISDFSANLYTVIHHLEIIRHLKDVHFVYVSSGGTVYGNCREEQPLTEEHGQVPLSPYGITKLTCEKYVLMYKEIYGLHVNIVRPSNMYGPGQRPFLGQGFIATAMAKLIAGQPVQIFGDGTHVRDYLYITDFCNALHRVLEEGENGDVYNIGFGQGYSINEVLEMIQHTGGLENISVEYLPARPFDVHYNVLNTQKLRAAVGWQPETTMEQGLQHSMEWVKDYMARKQ